MLPVESKRIWVWLPLPGAYAMKNRRSRAMDTPAPAPPVKIGEASLAENSTATLATQGETTQRSPGISATLSKNVSLSFARVAVNALIALVLPAYLTHRLPVTIYGAWVLILQLGAFVSFLDFGVQTGVAKFVAEYDAKGDEAGAGAYASAGLFLMTIAAALGLGLTVLLAWQVPRLFHNMPATLYRDVRMSVVLVGASLSFGLVCSVFSAIFLGLQRYAFPMGILIANRGIYTIVVCATVFFHGSLAIMSTGVLLVNISTGILQIAAWHFAARRIRISLFGIDPKVLRQVLGYCAVLAIWSAAMLCISGMDVTIVGHYAFRETAYYSLATLPANLIALIVSAAMGPLLPAASALSTYRTPLEMGAILSRTTRYSTTLVLLAGLPLLVAGYPILRLWVGPAYAQHSVWYLQMLVLATMLRNLCLPYATMVIATGKQRLATTAAISEAVVNLVSSIYLARSIGAIGVAVGTLIGAFVSVSMHFASSMHYTYATISISRLQLFWKGLLRPVLVSIPTALAMPFWWKASGQVLSPGLALAWASATLLIAWLAGLNSSERTALLRLARVK
jgi:O-antigen/teichoic acid export membrane protein